MAFVFALSLGLALFVQPASAQADASDIIAVGEMAPDITSRAPHATESSRTRSACRNYGERWWYWRSSSEREPLAEQFKWKRTVISTSAYSEADVA